MTTPQTPDESSMDERRTRTSGEYRDDPEPGVPSDQPPGRSTDPDEQAMFDYYRSLPAGTLLRPKATGKF